MSDFDRNYAAARTGYRTDQVAIDAGLRRFDFTIGDESYKLEWSDTLVTLYDHVAAATARGWPIAALTLAQHRLKRAIKQDPRVWRAFQQLRSVFGSQAR